MSISLTIENIEGTNHTVVWNNPSLKNKSFFDGYHYTWSQPCPITNMRRCDFGTALPPIPEHITEDTSSVLHLYAAFGLIVCGKDIKKNTLLNFKAAEAIYGFSLDAWIPAFAIDKKTGERFTVATLLSKDITNAN